ncbi:MAG TPA: NAD(P)/FAD-dependent oxidoreductase [Verrucomicrobiae bacterium]|nr:NAD(P)/FAD-dependent oxidoreductase [Verrucomicrobiae bacterium]
MIVGGGIAGSSLAIMLGRSGFAVRLFEKSLFPREKPCGEGLMPAGVAVLKRWGLDERVDGCHFHGVRFYFGAGSTTPSRYKTFRFQSPGLGQRRKVLDQALISCAAATPGVHVYTGARVDGLIREHDAVKGLRVAGQEYRAPLVVAADGAQSIIRKKLGLNDSVKPGRFGVRAHFRLADAKPQIPWVEVFIGNKIEIYATPLPNREISVALLAEVGTFRGSAKAEFLSLCRSFPALADRLEGAEQITQLMGAAPISGNTRDSSTPGAVLLGDAAGHADPVTGTGMTQALITAELLTKHLMRRKKGDAAWSRPFEQQRRAILAKYRTMARIALWLSQKPNLARPVSSAADFWSSRRVKFNSDGRPEQTCMR